MDIFYSNNINDNIIELSVSESHHCMKVMRKKRGDTVIVLDGNGCRYIATIIEVDKLFEIEYHKKEKENLVLEKPLHVLDIAKDFLHKNNIFNVSFIDSNKVYNKLNKPYDLVVSLRSWGFLVDLDEYLDFVNANLVLNGTVIIDINKRTLWKKKFEKYFNNTRIINEYVAHYRMIGTKK